MKGTLAAEAAARCPPPIESWAVECAASTGLDARLRACHPDGFVVEVHAPDGTVLDVDVARARPAAFRRVGDVSIAPIGDFADWAAEPFARQSSLDGVTECVRRATPSLELLRPSMGFDEGTDSIRGPAVSTVPWLLVALLAMVAVRMLARWRHSGGRKGPVRDVRSAAFLAGLSLATFAVRWIVVPHAFFHQNGQGPGWVDAAWRRIQSAYGPGYAEVYGWVASRSPEAPDSAVFLANACAGATIPALAYALVRRGSSSRWIAGAAGIAFAIAPIGARLAQSESYFLPITWLLFVATLALADAARVEVRSTESVADVAIAALAISQAARIHPIAWIPAAISPLVMLAVNPQLRTAIRRATVATAVVGLAVLLLAGRAMWDVVHGPLGPGWMPSAGHTAGETVVALLLGGALLVWLLTRAPSAKVAGPQLAPVALLALIVAVATTTNLLRAASTAVNVAYAGLYAPAVVAILAGGAPPWISGMIRTHRLREWVCGLAIVIGGGLFAIASARATGTLPTDARELSWMLGWRRSIPRGAVVCWYGHAGQRMLDPPFYRRAEMPLAIRLENGMSPSPTEEAYYVHTSLCATDEGRAACEGFENSHTLIPVERAVLPAIGSLPYLPFHTPTVEVALYRLGSGPLPTGTARSPTSRPTTGRPPP